MSRQIIQVFEEYQKSRVKFVQTVADLASRPQHVEPLQSAGVMQLLRPLLLDNVPSIAERCACTRPPRLQRGLAENVVSGDILGRWCTAERPEPLLQEVCRVRASRRHSPPSWRRR